MDLGHYEEKSGYTFFVHDDGIIHGGMWYRQ